MPESKRVVISFGRFNPPTTGHQLLLQFVRKAADRLGADTIVFPSQSQDPKKNPLPFLEKVKFLRAMMSSLAYFSDSPAIRTPIHALDALSKMGYKEVYVVVGSDRVAEFQKFGNYVRKTGKGPNIILLDKYEVIPVPGERDADSDDVQGMSASKMRAFAVAGKYKDFRSGVPSGSEVIAKQLYKSVRKHMGITESTTFAIYGATPAAAVPLREALKRYDVLDLTGKSLPEIMESVRSLTGRIVIYTRNAAMPTMNESTIRMQATYGGLKRTFPNAIVDVQSLTAEDAIRDVRTHARLQLAEAPAENPFHKILTERGFVLAKTALQQPHPLKKTSLFDEWTYVYPKKKTFAVVTKYDGSGAYGRTWTWRVHHEQTNGIMSPTTGDTKPQMQRTLERDGYVVGGLKEATDGPTCPECGKQYRLTKLSKIGLLAPGREDQWICPMSMPYSGCGSRFPLDSVTEDVNQASEVDRLKDTQKQQTLMMKQRQQQDLLGARSRELQKKSRETQAQINNGQRPASVTR